MPQSEDPARRKQREEMQAFCAKHLEESGIRGFILLGYHLPDGGMDWVFSMRKANPILAAQGGAWMTRTVLEGVKPQKKPGQSDTSGSTPDTPPTT